MSDVLIRVSSGVSVVENSAKFYVVFKDVREEHSTKFSAFEAAQNVCCINVCYSIKHGWAVVFKGECIHFDCEEEAYKYADYKRIKEARQKNETI